MFGIGILVGLWCTNLLGLQPAVLQKLTLMDLCQMALSTLSRNVTWPVTVIPMVSCIICREYFVAIHAMWVLFSFSGALCCSGICIPVVHQLKEEDCCCPDPQEVPCEESQRCLENSDCADSKVCCNSTGCAFAVCVQRPEPCYTTCE